MRKDMKQVIIERPRTHKHGARPNRHKIQISDLDENYEFRDADRDYPNKISALHDAVGDGDRKYQSDLWGPMRRFLYSRVGQPWDQVWSEICENNKDFMGQHLRQHLSEFVTTNLKRIDGELYTSENQPVKIWALFYVDPDSNLLSVFKKHRYTKKEPVQKVFDIDGQQYYKYDNVWYRVEFEPYIDGKYQCDVFGFANVFLYSREIKRILTQAYGFPSYCVWKQQANSKECKKLKLCA